MHIRSVNVFDLLILSVPITKTLEIKQGLLNSFPLREERERERERKVETLGQDPLLFLVVFETEFTLQALKRVTLRKFALINRIR
jgi:hypothetical protein